MTDASGTRTGTIGAASRREAAVALSGALAELGIQVLELNGRPLATRVTDLPGLLVDAADGSVLKIEDLGEATISGDTIAWRAVDHDLARALAAISSAR